MKTNYSITLSAKNADNTKSIIASLSDNEMIAIQEVNRANYSIEIHRIHIAIPNLRLKNSQIYPNLPLVYLTWRHPEFLLEHTGQFLRILESQGIGNLINGTICKTMNLLWVLPTSKKWRGWAHFGPFLFLTSHFKVRGDHLEFT